MAKPKGARSGSSKSRGGAASINAIKTFKDTLQEGSVDECRSDEIIYLPDGILAEIGSLSQSCTRGTRSR